MSSHERSYVAGLRPSRIREVQAGALAWATVDLIDIDGFDVSALRSPLESFGLAVRLHRIGQARHLAAALGGGVNGEYVVLLPRRR